MTEEGQVQPGESRTVAWKQGPPRRTSEHGGIWKGKPFWVEKYIYGHVREVGNEEGQQLKGCLRLKKPRTVSHYCEKPGDTHPVLLHAGWWYIY